jgi:hypothetical protein
MLVMREAENITPPERISLLQSSVGTPEILIGWQVM